MSWDAVLLHIKGKWRPVEEVGDDDYLPLGKRQDVLSAIMRVFPTAEWETPTQLFFRDGDLSIEFVPQGRNPIESMIIEVRGEGDPIPPLVRLATSNGWVLLDTSTSEFIDPGEPSDEGYAGYRKLVRGFTSRKSRRPSNRPTPPKQLNRPKEQG